MNLSKRLSWIDEKVSAAVVAIHADKHSSEALRSAIAEVWGISRKAIGTLKSADERLIKAFARDIELAGSAAKRAVENTPELKDRTRQAVLNAYAMITSLSKPN